MATEENRMNDRDWILRGALSVILLTCALAPNAGAQWTVVNLHPEGASESRAYGVDGDTQAGYATYGGVYRAGLWNGSAASWVELDPSGSLRSKAVGAGAGLQVGFAYVPTYANAGYWSGSRESWVNLNPFHAGVLVSDARDADGNQQVGTVSLNSNWRASLWSGTAESWVNLDPYLSSWSEGSGVGDGQQVGRARVNNVTGASLWSGTAASWVSLHPDGASSSFAYDVDDGQQVGCAYVGNYRASLWAGTADSWVNLNPEGSTQSQAFGVHAGQQVGYADLGGIGSACLWNGSADALIDLHAFLPAEFSSSEAHGITHGADTYVVGWGYNTVTRRNEALLWIGPLPAAGVAASQRIGALRLVPARPNPFRGATTIAFSTVAEGRVRLEVIGVNGCRTATLLDCVRTAGHGQARWNAEGIPAGIYFCRLTAGDGSVMQRLVVLK